MVLHVLVAAAAGLAVWTVAALGLLAFLYRSSPKRRWVAALVCRLNGYRHRGDEGVVLQTRSLSCGAACVEMALLARGAAFEACQLRDLRAMEGTSMLDLKRAFDSFRVPADGWSLGHSAALERVVQAGATALITLDGSYVAARSNILFAPLSWLLAPLLRRVGAFARHWVFVRSSLDGAGLAIHDPCLGVIELDPASLVRYWDGTALVVR